MRGLQHVAAGVEDDIGRRVARGSARAGSGPASRAAVAAATAPARCGSSSGTAPRQRVSSGVAVRARAGKAARHLHHKARVDAVLAGRDAIAAAAADLAPADRVFIAAAAGDQIDDGGGRRRSGRRRAMPPARSSGRRENNRRSACRRRRSFAPRAKLVEVPCRRVNHPVTAPVWQSSATA